MNLLTDQDMSRIQALVRLETDPIKERLERLEQKVENIPSKDEFFDYMDKFMKEVKTEREEQVFLSHRAQVHDDQIQTIADHVGISL